MSTTNDVPGFEQDIKPLFRDVDKEAMDYIFDLWNYQDVSKNANGILERLEDGTMPCDIEWSEAQIETFRRWMATGKSA